VIEMTALISRCKQRSQVLRESCRVKVREGLRTAVPVCDQ